MSSMRRFSIVHIPTLMHSFIIKLLICYYLQHILESHCIHFKNKCLKTCIFKSLIYILLCISLKIKKSAWKILCFTFSRKFLLKFWFTVTLSLGVYFLTTKLGKFRFRKTICAVLCRRKTSYFFEMQVFLFFLRFKILAN